MSNTINLLLEDKTQHIVVEPDKSVIGALETNKNEFSSKFTIVDAAICNCSELYLVFNQYGSYTTSICPVDVEKFIKIDTISSGEFFCISTKKFNVLVVDCEGCIENFLIDNMGYLDNLELIIFEKDNLSNCNYNNVYHILSENNFVKHDAIELIDPEGFQQVWIRKKL